MQRDDDARHRELTRDVDAVERPASAERHQAEVTGVKAALNRVQADRVDHVLGDDPRHPERGVLRVESELLTETSRHLPRGGLLDLELPGQARLGPQPAEHDLDVGGRRLGPPVPVARRAGVGPGALRADAQQAPGVDSGDRPAAGPDGVQVGHRDHDVIPGEVGVIERLHPQLPARRDADIRGGPSDVERDHAVQAGGAAHGHPADDPGHRPGHEQLRGPLRGRVDGERAPVGRHQVELAVRRHLADGDVHPL